MEDSNDTWFSGLDMMSFTIYDFEECVHELRLSPKDERLVLLMHFPHYCEVGKRDLFLRTLIIWDADKYLCRTDTTENMKLFCERIKAEFTHFDQSRSIMTIYRQLRDLHTNDFCTVALKNNYYRKLMIQSPAMKRYLLNSLDQKIEETRAGSTVWEYLAYCVRKELICGPSKTIAQQLQSR